MDIQRKRYQNGSLTIEKRKIGPDEAIDVNQQRD